MIKVSSSFVFKDCTDQRASVDRTGIDTGDSDINEKKLNSLKHYVRSQNHTSKTAKIIL